MKSKLVIFFLRSGDTGELARVWQQARLIAGPMGLHSTERSKHRGTIFIPYTADHSGRHLKQRCRLYADMWYVLLSGLD